MSQKKNRSASLENGYLFGYLMALEARIERLEFQMEELFGIEDYDEDEDEEEDAFENLFSNHVCTCCESAW